MTVEMEGEAVMGAVLGATGRAADQIVGKCGKCEKGPATP